MSVNISLKKINNKNIFITEKHHHNLIPWAEIRKLKSQGLFVLMLDHHSDTRDAFTHYTFNAEKMECDKAKIKQELEKMYFDDSESIKNAVHNLRNDEHIDAAIKTNIIEKIFIICYQNSATEIPVSYEMKSYVGSINLFSNVHPPPPNRPFSYPPSNVYIPENLCFIGCNKLPHDDACQLDHFNQAIESTLLQHKLNIFEEMNNQDVKNGFFVKEYILDIDLDYFHTMRSINPNDYTLFHKIIRNSEFITITKEKEFIDLWRDEFEYDSTINVDNLLEKLFEHIYNATL